MRDDMGLVAGCNGMVAAALIFRDIANADSDFVIYKTLVGYNSVFPPAWKDKEFRFKMANAYRSEQVDVLLNVDAIRQLKKDATLVNIRLLEKFLIFRVFSPWDANPPLTG